MRLIDADALKESMGECPLNWNDSPEEIQETFDWNNFTQLIDEAPTIDAELVRHGHWVNRGKDLEVGSMEMFDAWSCSRCRYYIHKDGYPKWKYCPMCGVKMDKENTNDGTN